jgi:acyl-CoA synthetase (AMP-forming)/AMP-acid ligase II
MINQELIETSSGRVGIVATNSTSYVEAMFDCMEAGLVAVPLREADDHYRINAARVDRVITLETGEAWMTRKINSIESDNTALIAFTSGTEGSPKGVILTQRNLGSVIARLNTLMQVDSNISEYVGVPVYHSFGFGRCRAVASAGGRFYIPNSGFNPSEIGDMLKRGEVNAISAVPSLWRILLANEDLIGSSGKLVRWIEIGSQYMSREEKEKLKSLFPNARIVQHYGLTEASRTTLLEIHQEEGDRLESVGKAIDDVEVKLTPDGLISIRGEHVASHYLIDGQTAQIQDDDGWLTTKDLGAIDNGYLYYKGRADDVINCGGIKVPPEALETKIYANIGIASGLAVCRKSDPIRGEGFLVAVTKEINIDKERLQEVILQATQEFGVNAGNAITIIDVDELPKTASGKVQRNKLSQMYALEVANKGEELSQTAISASDETPIRAAFRRVLNLRKNLTPEDTFISLGGDSLSYVQVSIEIERILGYIPKGWEEMSLGELEKQVPEARKLSAIETNIVLRAFAILAVVANHAALIPAGYIRGGSYLLLLIAGANFARFQSGALLQGNLIKPISSLLRNLLIPYFIIALLYMFYKQEIELSIILLFSNFLPFEAVSRIFGVWFIQVLVQIIIVFTLVFCIKPVRAIANKSPWRFGLILLAVGICMNLLMLSIWDTSGLRHRLPHMLFWIFTLGWCINFSQSRFQKIVVTIAVFVTLILLNVSTTLSQTLWIFMGGSIMIWQQYVSIPKVMKMPIQIVSAAAYWTFLTHIAFIEGFIVLFGPNYPFLYFVASVLLGVIIWFIPQLSSLLFTKINSDRQKYSNSI